MKSWNRVLVGCPALLLLAAAGAELREVQVGGAIELYGHYYNDFFENGAGVRIPGSAVAGRPIGGTAQDDSGSVLSIIRTFGQGEGAGGLAWVEQRTSLHVRARFTESVSSFVEFDHIDVWGEDFRSDFISGADSGGAGDVSLYQAYVEADALFGWPLRLRLGRQELVLGNEWLVGNNFWADPLTYLSFDGLRLTWEREALAVDLFCTKLAERFEDFGDTDTDFYGVYGTWTGLEDWEVNAYWLFLHDGLDIEDSVGAPVLDFVASLRGLNDFGDTEIHTVGLRVHTAPGQWALEAEAAYQWGEAALAGSTFAVAGIGDDDATYGTWAGQISAGYTFEHAWAPHLYVGAEYYGGEDNRDRGLLEFLNPFYRPEASVSFNRLFSTWEADWFIDGSALSNVWIAKAGISANPTEKITAGLDVLYFETLAAFDTPVFGRVGPNRAPLTLLFPFVTRESDKDLGVETILWAEFAYSDDVSFEAGWAHFFTGDGLADGNFVGANGLEFLGGLDDEDADYLWFGAKLTF